MSFPIPAISSARLGLQGSLRRLDRAAEAIARAGLEMEPNPLQAGGSPAGQSEAPEPKAPMGPESVDLPEAIVSMLIAQRAFSANLRVMEAADRMSAVRRGGT